MKASHFSTDIVEFIRLLSGHGVRYVIVGGEAVIYHGHARLTGDVDVFYEDGEANARKLFAALSEFWNGRIPCIDTHEDLLVPGQIVQFGVPPNRLDLLATISGVSFQEAWESRIEERMDLEGSEIPVYFIGKDMLLRNKKSAARDKDLDDLRYLET